MTDLSVCYCLWIIFEQNNGRECECSSCWCCLSFCWIIHCPRWQWAVLERKGWRWGWAETKMSSLNLWMKARARMWPRCRVCGRNLRLRYVDAPIELSLDKEHGWREDRGWDKAQRERERDELTWCLETRFPCSTWNRCAHRVSSSFSQQTSSVLSQLVVHVSWMLYDQISTHCWFIIERSTYIPCNRLWRFTVYSRVTTSLVICFLLLPLSPFFAFVFAMEMDEVFLSERKFLRSPNATKMIKT